MVVLGGAVAATAAVVRHSDQGVAVRAIAVGPDGLADAKLVKASGRGGGIGTIFVKGGQVAPVALPASGIAGTQLAPAPLPTLAAAQAAEKAAAAVAGGRVESLTTEAEQGGGSAWLATVIGPDGVLHLVTVDGTSGAITSNTTTDG